MKSDESGKNLQWIFYSDTDNIEFIRMIVMVLYRKQQDITVIRSWYNYYGGDDLWKRKKK